VIVFGFRPLNENQKENFILCELCVSVVKKRKILFINDLESNTGAAGRNPGDFAGYQMGFHGGGKGDFHRDFLPDRQTPAGFNKSTAGTDVINRCLENTMPGFAVRCRQDLGELLPPVIPFFKVLYTPVSNKIIAHLENQ
jgi:hypothetical protein